MKSPVDRALHGALDRAAHSRPDGRGLAVGRQVLELARPIKLDLDPDENTKVDPAGVDLTAFNRSLKP